MIKRRVLPLVLLLALALSACGAIGNQAPRTLSVTGTGTVRVSPDIVTVNLGVQTVGENVATAVADNNRRSQRVHEAVLEAGIAEEDFRTVYFSVSPQQGYDEFGNPSGVVTYWVDNTISVTLRAVDELGALLDAAIDAGATSIQGVSFGVDDPTEAEEQAREEAIQDAQARAEMLAGAAGATLGDVLSINTTFAPAYFEGVVRVEGIGGGGGVPVAPGTSEIQVSVNVVYELK